MMKSAWQHKLSGLAALICAMSVAMSAYASHGFDGEAQHRLMTASYFAFAHGLSIIVLARVSSAKSNLFACCFMLLGLVLFSGSLAGAALFQSSTILAPSGGSILILSWCWVAVNFFRLKKDDQS